MDFLIASSVLPAGKPDPRAFLHAAARLDVEEGVLGAEVPRVRTLAELEFSPF